MKHVTTVIFAVFLFVVSVGMAAETDWSKPDTINATDVTILKEFDVVPQTFLVAGWQAYQDKKYEEATQNYLAYLYHVKNDSGNMYNLACCYGLMGNAELASAWLDKAFQAGWADMDHTKQDPDFTLVRDSDLFKKTISDFEAKLSKDKGDPGKMLMVPAQSMIPMYMKLPEKYDPEKTYPLVLGLHGFGGTAENYAQIWDRVKVTKEFIYVAMEAPYALSMGKTIGYSWFVLVNQEKYPDAVKKGGEMTISNILKGLESLKKQYKIGKVYLTGFSQGAGLTFMTGLKHPELFAGIAPFGGWLDTDVITEADLKAATSLPVLIIHGNKDASVEFKSGQEAEALLKKHGYNVELFEFDGGHVVREDGLNKLQEMIK